MPQAVRHEQQHTAASTNVTLTTATALRGRPVQLASSSHTHSLSLFSWHYHNVCLQLKQGNCRLGDSRFCLQVVSRQLGEVAWALDHVTSHSVITKNTHDGHMASYINSYQLTVHTDTDKLHSHHTSNLHSSADMPGSLALAINRLTISLHHITS